MPKIQWLGIIVFFIALSGTLFHPYFTKRQLPIPANLLVSYYNPWTNDGYEKIANKPIGFDVVRLFLSFRDYTTEQLKKGELPLWNPYVFSGNVHLGTYQSAVFYPLNVLYFILPLVDAWSMLVILQPILAGLLMFIFLRVLGLSKRAGFIGAVFWTTSGWMIAWSEEALVIEHSILWLPMALTGSTLIWQQGAMRKGAILTTLALVLSILAGFLQSTIYVVLLAIAWNIWLATNHPKRMRLKIVAVTAAFIAAALITAIQWLPALEAYSYSPRGIVDVKFLFDSYLLPLAHMVTLIAPDFWGNPGVYSYFHYDGFYHERVLFLGIVPLIFALYAFIKQKDRSILFWKLTTVIVLLLAFKTPLAWLLYSLKIPLLSVMLPSRILMLFAFCASVLAAYGVQRFLVKKSFREVLFPLCSVFGIFIVAWSFVALTIAILSYCPTASLPKIATKIICPYYAPDTRGILTNYSVVTMRNMLLPTAFFLSTSVLFLFLRKKARLLLGSLLVVHLVSSMYFAQKYLYFSDRAHVYPKNALLTTLQELAGLWRVWSYGNGYIDKNLLFPSRLYSPEGYDAVYPQWYGELLHAASQNGRVQPQIHRTDAQLPFGSERDPVLSNIPRKRLLELLGVRFIVESKSGDLKEVLTTEERFPADRFRLAWENERFRIWEFSSAMPRAYLVPNYIVETDRQKRADLLFDERMDITSSAVVEETIQELPPTTLMAINPADRATIQQYGPNNIDIQTTSTTAKLLVLSDTYYPGWKAYVNGHETKIYRANYAFRAVRIPSGTNMVRFVYAPASVRWGFLMTALGFLIMGVFIRNSISPKTDE